MEQRNVFPPTPPPEMEKPQPQIPSRGQSVRNGAKPPPARSNTRANQGYQLSDDGRSASGRPEPRRQNTQGGSTRGPQRQNTNAPRNRQSDDYPDENGDEYPGELYDMYSSSGRGSRSSRGTAQSRSRPQQRYDEEESQYASDYDDGSFDENDFEMMAPAPRAAPSSRAGSTRGGSRRPDIRKIRVKVHAEDTRYIMIGPAIEFPDLVDRVREKFGMRKRFKIKVRDDDGDGGEMITMADQDDLDMAIMSVKANARKEKLDMGKLSIWIQEVN